MSLSISLIGWICSFHSNKRGNNTYIVSYHVYILRTVFSDATYFCLRLLVAVAYLYHRFHLRSH